MVPETSRIEQVPLNTAFGSTTNDFVFSEDTVGLPLANADSENTEMRRIKICVFMLKIFKRLLKHFDDAKVRA